MTLRNSPVPRNQYIHLLPMMIPPKFTNMLDYIDTNISQPLVSWDTAKQLFLQHYQVADWLDTYKREYNSCSQGAKESVQRYADRFLTLSNRLRYDDHNPVNIENFIQRLHPIIQNELTRHRLLLRDTNPIWDWTSLQQVIQKAIEFDVLLNSIHRKVVVSSETSAATSTSTPNKNKRSNKSISSNKTTDSKLKECIHHPNSTTHSTSECRSSMNKRPKTSTQSTIFTCYSCGEVGHISPNCPNRKSSGRSTKPTTTHQQTKNLSRSHTPTRTSSRLVSTPNSKLNPIKAKAVTFTEEPGFINDEDSTPGGISNDL